MPSIHIKPNIDPGTKLPHKIRLPGKPHEFLPEEGTEVDKNKFWNRRLRDLSVVEIKKIVPAKEQKTDKTTTKE